MGGLPRRSLWNLALDLGVLSRKSETVSLKSALTWTGFWVALSLAFAGIIHWQFGQPKALQFLTGYVVEYALSVDNIFVFILVFSYFKVPAQLQHRVLFWGIIGAFVMRGAMIFAGTALIHRFEWLIYVFGAFLVYTGIKLAFGSESEVDPGHNPAVKLLRKVMPVSEKFEDGKILHSNRRAPFCDSSFSRFVGRSNHRPYFRCRFNSRDSLDFTRPVHCLHLNVCAILGLRSLYFAVSGIMDLFHYLKYGLAIVLTFIGAKMLIHSVYDISIGISLGVILAVLSGSILLSVIRPVKEHDLEDASPVELHKDN